MERIACERTKCGWQLDAPDRFALPLPKLCKPLKTGTEVELLLAKVLIELADWAFILAAFTGGGKG